MRRLFTFFSLLLLTVIGGFLFHVKYQVVEIERNLKIIERQTTQTLEALHVLKAEWACLNKPERLQKLARRYLDIAAPEAGQMIPVFASSSEKERP